MVGNLCIDYHLADNNSFPRFFKEVSHLKAVLLVAAGGILGSLSRYFLEISLPGTASGNLVANILASAFAAHIFILMQRRGITSLRYFLLPGFCGGLSTFSAVTYEVIAPDEGSFTYLVLNIVFSLTAIVISLRLSEKLVRHR